MANMYKSMGLIYSREVSVQASILFAEILKEYNYQEVERIMRKWLVSEKSIPTPAQVINKITNEITEEESCELIAQAICACISTCGYTNPDRAKIEIGELGFSFIVDSYGSWEAFCRNIDTNESLNIIRSQIPKRLIAFKKRKNKITAIDGLRKISIDY